MVFSEGKANMENELILFETADKEIKLTVPIKNNTVWLNRKQLAELFGRDVKTMGKHINNALKEELDNSVVANFATTASDGKVYQVEHYNLDMIISIGYRVKSNRGVEFRKWANSVLKQYIIQGYAINEKRLEALQRTINIQTKMLACRTVCLRADHDHPGIHLYHRNGGIEQQ